MQQVLNKNKISCFKYIRRDALQTSLSH